MIFQRGLHSMTVITQLKQTVSGLKSAQAS
ncbi:DUF1657 domain-containing protein, partial [Bacillus anthracis]|nr:DUF1657 domain-containing protein [Bacillus anthracis]